MKKKKNSHNTRQCRFNSTQKNTNKGTFRPVRFGAFVPKQGEFPNKNRFNHAWMQG